MTHPLLDLLLDAARGRPPAPDGAVEVLPGLPGPVDAVLAFTAHHVSVADVDRHERVARALHHRAGVAVWSDPEQAGMLLLGRGLAGRRELAFEVEPARRNRGLGRRLVAAARHLTPPGEPLFAQVAPGNAASLRAVAAAGFRPFGAEVLFDRAD